MIDITELDSQHVYSVLLRNSGAVIGTLIFPLDRISKESLGGFRIMHPRTTPTVKNGNLHFFTLDVGIGVYEVLIPLEQIEGIYRLGSIEEPIIKSPDEALWRELSPDQSWSIPLGRILVNESTKLIQSEKLRFRPIVELPDVASYPHPVSFPRYAPFKPKHSLVVYLDHDIMACYFRHFERTSALLQIFQNHSLVPFSQLTEKEIGTLVFIEGAIGFFEPPQTVTWRGKTTELVAITPMPFSQSKLDKDWILGCVRNVCFPFFRESIERIACTYYMCGEWREIGLFESEYGSRRCALFLAAGVCFDEETSLEGMSNLPFEMTEYQAVGQASMYTYRGALRRQSIPSTSEEGVDKETEAKGLSYTEQGKVIKILFLAANPSDTARLRLDRESRAIDQALRQAEFRDKFDIRQHWAVSVGDIQELLLRHRPDIVHFSGHGSRSSEIILEDDLGNSHSVPAGALSDLFYVLKDNIRCVVLNACYSEQQARAIVEHIDCVVGMSEAIGDQSAISFATAFYRALGYGRDVETAFKLGRMQINLENLGEQDKPKLLAVKSEPSKIVFASEG